MADVTSVDLPRRVGENVEQASPDVLRMMVQMFAAALTGGRNCGAPHRQISHGRGTTANGYRQRRRNTGPRRSNWRFPSYARAARFPHRLGSSDDGPSRR
jgi:hypothetical protein